MISVIRKSEVIFRLHIATTKKPLLRQACNFRHAVYPLYDVTLHISGFHVCIWAGIKSRPAWKRTCLLSFLSFHHFHFPKSFGSYPRRLISRSSMPFMVNYSCCPYSFTLSIFASGWTHLSGMMIPALEISSMKDVEAGRTDD